MRDTVRERSLLCLIQGGVTVAAGALALVFPAFASTGVLTLLGWLLTLSGAVQVVPLTGATQVATSGCNASPSPSKCWSATCCSAARWPGPVAVSLLMRVLFLVGGVLGFLLGIELAAVGGAQAPLAERVRRAT